METFKTFKRTVFTGLLFFCCSVIPVQAAKVSLTSAVNFVTLGEEFSLDLVLDFSDQATLGGGVDINYDSDFVDFLGFEFNSDFLLISDPLFTCPSGTNACTPIDQADKVENIVFGNFAGIGGVHTVGTVSYELNSLELTSIFPSITTASGGPFVSSVTNLPMNVNFSGVNLRNGTISQGTTVIPVPASIWFFLTALIPLVVRNRKNNLQPI